MRRTSDWQKQQNFFKKKWIVPLITVEIQFFCAASALEGRMSKESVDPCMEFDARRKLEAAIVFEHVGRSEQP